MPKGKPPIADAGEDQVVWLGAGELILDGSASTGDELTHRWSQVGGPVELEVGNAFAARTVATAIPGPQQPNDRAIYEFELTVTDRHGQHATDSVRYTALAGPSLTIKPGAKRSLVYRDGFPLVHFEITRANRSGYSEIIELSYASALAIQHLGGSAEFDLVADDSGSRPRYEIVVYYREAEPTSFLEFFLDTAEGIPAVLQVHITWE
jgi:hypothetical protein